MSESKWKWVCGQNVSNGGAWKCKECGGWLHDDQMGAELQTDCPQCALRAQLAEAQEYADPVHPECPGPANREGHHQGDPDCECWELNRRDSQGESMESTTQIRPLYELAGHYQRLLTQVDPETGEIPDGLVQELDELEGDIEHKVINCGLQIKNLKAEQAMVKEEEDKLAARRKTLAGKIEWLSSYVVANTIKSKNTKISAPGVVVSYLRSEYVDADGADLAQLWLDADEGQGPSVPVTREITYKLNKTDAKAALKGGAKIPGVALGERWNLQVK